MRVISREKGLFMKRLLFKKKIITSSVFTEKLFPFSNNAVCSFPLDSRSVKDDQLNKLGFVSSRGSIATVQDLHVTLTLDYMELLKQGPNFPLTSDDI